MHGMGDTTREYKMKFETYDNLEKYLGKTIPNRVLAQIIAENFNCSNRLAKSMVSAMLRYKEFHKNEGTKNET